MRYLRIILGLTILWSSFAHAQDVPSLSQAVWEKDKRGRNRCFYKEFNGVTICTTCEEVSDYGKYFRIWVILINNTGHDITFAPTSNVQAAVLNSRGDEKSLSIQSARDYSRRIKRTHNGELFLQGIESAMETYNASHRTVTTTINEAHVGGSVYAGAEVGTYGSSVYGGASAYAGASSTTIQSTIYDPMAEAIAKAKAEIEYANTKMSQASENKEKIELYIKNKPIPSGDTMFGYFNILKKKGDDLIYDIVVEDISFPFKWNIKEDKNTVVTN